MTMRDKIAEALVNVLEHYRSSQSIETHAADAIIAALPDMIAPLVWLKSETLKCCVSGKYLVQHEHDARGAGVWAFGTNDGLVSDHHNKSDAITAANAHHRAAIMAAFN